MTQTPLERAAEQLLKANDPEGYAYWIAGGKKQIAQRHYDQARAVLLAIRDPSDAMLLSHNGFDAHLREVWQAMIDAALGE